MHKPTTVQISNITKNYQDKYRFLFVRYFANYLNSDGSGRIPEDEHTDTLANGENSGEFKDKKRDSYK